MKSITLLALLTSSVICRHQDQTGYGLGDQQQCDLKFANSIVRSKLPSQHIVTSLEDMGCYNEAKAFKQENGLNATEDLEDQQQCDIKFANAIIRSKLPGQHIITSLEDMGCNDEAKAFKQANGLEDNEYGDKPGEWDNLDPNFYEPSYYSETNQLYGHGNRNANPISINNSPNNAVKGASIYSNKNSNRSHRKPYYENDYYY
ncbi:hypothetical protein CONCODRAFT_19040 [Conidiobolus coronatus NRRL 28638]|uniref:Uncharacterized protein n=1 Tax=Conidiobolus coronatus (strain ATCC 28846 / CBS 209.66 / NRRL 28638) TaxID=796925 RepID=A0A137NZU2_CONC2|nr:hypothetical protein CONCODRAFT_19040 [Conidiobolus coronatus NRRL 28638]|eukprot:KXN68325.1 hypothetical protein CONCODRAFT_19040 [Conidiobolus coronatus NRRL 28638]